MASSISSGLFFCVLAVLAFQLYVIAEVNQDVISEHGLDLGAAGGRVYGAHDNHETSWPEVVGLKVEKAKLIIRGDLAFDPDFVLVPQGSYVTMDFQRSRVRIFVDVSGETVVLPPPAVG